MITWTIGAGGLLGGAIQRSSTKVFTGPAIAWADTEESIKLLRTTAQEFASEVGQSDWAIIWAAGNASTSSSAADAQRELHTFTALTQEIREHHPKGRGAFFTASSAGGIYAGAYPPPFDDTTVPMPLSPYGELKLAQERQAVSALEGICPVVIGRLANLYGPGQNLDKLQGLISRLALASVTRQPINMFVSLDTMRDYIYTDDAAAVILHWVAEAIEHPSADAQIKVIASGQPVSLGYLIHLMQDIARTRIPVAFGVHESATAQALDLRLTPTTDVVSQHLVRMPLSAGVKMTYLDILERYQQALG